MWYQNVKYFWNGEFAEASNTVKDSWIKFVGKVMPCMNKNWTDEAVKISSLLSLHTSPSDEAMAITAIEKKMNLWLNHVNDNEESVVEELTNSEKTKKYIYKINGQMMTFKNFMISKLKFVIREKTQLKEKVGIQLISCIYQV
jgi:hypothetical protein